MITKDKIQEYQQQIVTAGIRAIEFEGNPFKQMQIISDEYERIIKEVYELGFTDGHKRGKKDWVKGIEEKLDKK